MGYGDVVCKMLGAFVFFGRGTRRGERYLLASLFGGERKSERRRFTTYLLHFTTDLVFLSCSDWEEVGTFVVS